MNEEDYDPYAYFAEQIKRFVPCDAADSKRPTSMPKALGAPYGNSVPEENQSITEVEG